MAEGKMLHQKRPERLSVVVEEVKLIFRGTKETNILGSLINVTNVNMFQEEAMNSKDTKMVNIQNW